MEKSYNLLKYCFQIFKIELCTLSFNDHVIYKDLNVVTDLLSEHIVY
jgi:hypothetical protein